VSRLGRQKASSVGLAKERTTPIRELRHYRDLQHIAQPPAWHYHRRRGDQIAANDAIGELRVLQRLCCVILFLSFVWPTATMADVDLLKVRTRFGTVSFVRNSEDCCTGYIRFRSQRIEILSAGDLFATLHGVYQMKEGDVLVVSRPAGGSGAPWPIYYVLLVDENGIADITDGSFQSADWTFQAVQKGNEIHFDLGFDKKLRKKAIYRDGILYVGFDLFRIESKTPKRHCDKVLDMLIHCKKISDCSDKGISDAIPMAHVRTIGMLENVPVFDNDNFYKVCAKVCASKPDNFVEARRTLCGY
jgi:hypothetical protein